MEDYSRPRLHPTTGKPTHLVLGQEGLSPTTPEQAALKERGRHQEEAKSCREAHPDDQFKLQVIESFIRSTVRIVVIIREGRYTVR